LTLAVLTGPTRGIGRATARGLAARGVDLALVGRPSAALEDVQHEMNQLGVRASSIPLDLGDSGAVEAAGRAILERHGPPDAVIHNAATLERAPVAELTTHSWERQLAVNLTAPFVLTRALLPAMVERGSGRHVYVSSISATLGTAGASAYCASKWALSGFVKSLAQELSDTGVIALALLPGSVDTAMLDGSGFEPRMSPEDVAKTLIFCALDAPVAHNGALLEMFGT
jgi:3-oxoacyl-[acyl-carrier protein] reductase